MSEEAAPFMALAVDLVRRFLPKADQSTLIMAAVWLEPISKLLVAVDRL
jgi:hypothetical protein